MGLIGAIRNQKQSWIKPNSIVWRIARLVRRLCITTGVLQWGTKSFEFWTLLMVILAIVRPKSIVELGSGRSTSYLAEYAMKKGIRYVSIEQNRFYATKIRRGLRNSFLDPCYLHHVPIDQDGWYKMERLKRVVNFPSELLYVDGPVGVVDWLGKGVRNCERSQKWLKEAAAMSKVIIVDDVQLRSNLEIFYRLISTSEKLSAIYLLYPANPYHVRKVPDVIAITTRTVPNVIAVAVESSFRESLIKVCSELKIEVLTDYSIDQCCEA
jgi:hypothetical protein